MRKCIYGPGIDEPVCMIETADSNAVYYYHHDGLGFRIALSDEDANTLQAYEYSVYGHVLGVEGSGAAARKKSTKSQKSP